MTSMLIKQTSPTINSNSVRLKPPLTPALLETNLSQAIYDRSIIK